MQRTTISRPETCAYDLNCFFSRPIQPNPLLAHQIQELIQFVSDEKDARESLQELAARLTGDLESLKHAQLTHTPAVGKRVRTNN